MAIKKSMKEKVQQDKALTPVVETATEELSGSDTATVTMKKNEKKQMISAYIDKDVYAAFRTINAARRISNNAALGLLIVDYVNEYKDKI